VMIASYNDRCPAPFYPSLHGWFGTTKFTRAWKPALLGNQLRVLTLDRKVGPILGERLFSTINC
jgi:hypothetical protein